jgi:DNA repair exonuclease SbcCD nuclease subunit
MIIFSDAHLRPETENIIFDEVLPGIDQAAKKHGGPIACLGDLFHIRYQVDVRIYNRLREVLWLWGEEFGVFLLPGNHDQYNVEGRNVLEGLGDIQGVRVFNEPTWTQEGLWIPYRKNLEDVRAALKMRKPKIKAAHVVFMHQGIQGAWMNNNAVADEGLDPADLINQRLVLCGHWHKHQVLRENFKGAPLVIFIGSPYQTKADEAGQQKGFLILTDEGDSEFMFSKWGPRYHQLTVQADGTLDTSDVEEGDIVRVSAPPGADVSALAKSLEGTQHAISVEVKPLEQRLNVDSQATLLDYARAYVKLKQPLPLQQGILLEEFQNLLVGDRQ